MENRKIDTLVVANEDYLFYGNLEISGKLIIKNGYSLVVSGVLTLSEDISIITVDGDISVQGLKVNTCVPFNINGDLFVAASLNLTYDTPILSNGEIYVKGNLSASTIVCFNLFVDGYINVNDITAEHDIYIMGTCQSSDLNARDIFFGDDAHLYGSSIRAWGSIFWCGTIYECSSLTIGK